MIFYEMQDKKIIPLEKLDLRHYNPEKRSVGFVAGNKIIAQKIMRELLELSTR